MQLLHVVLEGALGRSFRKGVVGTVGKHLSFSMRTVTVSALRTGLLCSRPLLGDVTPQTSHASVASVRFFLWQLRHKDLGVLLKWSSAIVEERSGEGELVVKYWLGFSGTSVMSKREGRAGCACSAHLLTCRRLRMNKIRI